MKNMKYKILILFAIVFTVSCVKIENDVNEIADGPNFAGFETKIQNVTQIADGQEYTVQVQMKVTGPNLDNVKEDIVATLGANEISTAVAGTHYRFDETEITLKADNNHLGVFEFTMLTEGVETPLVPSPVLALEVVTTSGNSSVKPSGPSQIVLNFACPSFLAGEYNVTTVRDDGGVRTWTETITEIGVGTYLTQYVGTWDPPLNPEGGFIFSDVCNEINVPQQDLAYGMYSNQVYSHKVGKVNDDGSFVIDYTIEFASGNATYSSTYVPL